MGIFVGTPVVRSDSAVKLLIKPSAESEEPDGGLKRGGGDGEVGGLFAMTEEG